MRPLHISRLAIALATSVLLGLPADAGMMAERAPTITVALGDLDLSTMAGLRTAHARIRRAAEAVCGENPHEGLIEPAEIRRCRALAIRDANDRLAPPVVASR